MKHRLLFERLPPSVNARYEVYRGRMILKAEYRDWLKGAAQDVAFYCAQNNLKPIEKYTVVELWWILPNHRIEHHNLEKPLFDALQRGGAFKNDRFVLNRTIEVTVVKDKEGVTMEFEG